MKTERKFTYLKKSETKDERVFNGDDPKENKAFFDALKADEKDRIESNKQSIDYFKKTLYKYKEIFACEIKTKNDAKELKALLIDRLEGLRELKGVDEFSERYNELINLAESLIQKIDLIFHRLPNTEPKETKEVEKTKNKAGRKKVEVKDVREYLKFSQPESKEVFLNELKKLTYIHETKEFVHLLWAMYNIDKLKMATQKEWQQAFEKELNVKHTQQGFNAIYNNKEGALLGKRATELKGIIDEKHLI